MLSVIVPAYNEEKVIGETIKVLADYLRRSCPGFEIVVVSDGSQDRTFEVASKFANKFASDRVRAFEYRPNQGKGHALKYGFGKTRGDMVVFYDTGANFPPSQIGDFLQKLQETESDLVIGSKRHPQSTVDYPFVRRLVSFGAQSLVKILFNLSVTDTQVGLKAFRRPVLERIMPLILVKRFAFDIELLALAQHYGFKIVEAPVKLDLKFSTALSFLGSNSILNCLVDTFAVFYRLKILRFYDLPEADRARLLREYRPTVWERLITSFIRLFRRDNK